MKSYAGKLAVVTGGGGGMGRELVLHLVAEGCSVATLDLAAEALEETVAMAREAAPEGVRVSGHIADTTDEAALEAARDDLLAQHEADHLDLLFNNAAIFGAGSFLTDDRAAWERVFSVCWYGVYNPCRVFVPLIVASEEGHVINTASANALRATHGPKTPSTAYSAGKWAVRGFTEALIEDFRTHAPHVKVSLVIPGGVGTDIRANSGRILGAASETGASTAGVDHLRSYLVGMGVPVEDEDDETIAHLMDVQQSDVFAWPVPWAAKKILEEVREDRWRIFVGVGVVELDEEVRADPETIYEPDGASLINRDMLISMMVLASKFRPEAGADVDGVYELHLDSTPVYALVADGELQLTRDHGNGSDLTVDANREVFRALVTKERSLDDAIAAADLRIEGDPQKLERLLGSLAV